MKPTQEQIDREVASSRLIAPRFPREVSVYSIIVALADRVAELERDRAEMIALLKRWNDVEDMDDEGPALLDVTEMLVARLTPEGTPNGGAGEGGT